MSAADFSRAGSQDEIAALSSMPGFPVAALQSADAGELRLREEIEALVDAMEST